MAALNGREVAVAVIGGGFIAGYHAEGLRAAGGARLAALVGRRRAATEARAADLGFARAETDHRSVLDDQGIDAVIVATPDDSHERIAIEALQAGKAVLLQKPMAMTAQGCRNILAAEAAGSGRLTVSFMHRFFPEVVWLRDLLASERLGPVHAFRIRNATPGADWSDWFYRPGAVAGGVVMQLGVHGIDLCRHLFGPVRELTALSRTAAPRRRLREGRTVDSDLEDNVLATYRLAGEVQGSHEMSCTELAGCDRFRLEVHAERGTVWLRSERGAAAMHAPELTGTRDWVTPPLEDERLGARHHRDWLAMVRGDAPRDDTAEAGLYSVVVAETIYRAAAGRAWLDVAPVSVGGSIR